MKRFGRPDVLVNNAGVHEGGKFAEIADEQWRKVMATDADAHLTDSCRSSQSATLPVPTPPSRKATKSGCEGAYQA